MILWTVLNSRTTRDDAINESSPVYLDASIASLKSDRNVDGYISEERTRRQCQKQEIHKAAITVDNVAEPFARVSPVYFGEQRSALKQSKLSDPSTIKFGFIG